MRGLWLKMVKYQIMKMINTVYTVGYSGYHQDVKRFVSDLRAHGIGVVVDVRTSPYSKYAPEYNREDLQLTLKANGLKYVFMGDELGARPSDRSCYSNGAVDYDKIIAAPFFQHGLDRIQEGIAKGLAITLLCAEKDPINCHRNVLVAHALSKRGVEIKHLIQLADGEPAVAEDREDTESRLFEECDQGDSRQIDLFMSRDEILEKVYRIRFAKIAYREEKDNDTEH